MTRTITRRPTIRDLAEVAKLTTPDWAYQEMVTGIPYEPGAWATGIDGSEYQPDVFSCDWLIRMAREAGLRPTLRRLSAIETILREERRDASDAAR